MKFCMAEPGLSGKKNFAQKVGKMDQKMGQKQGFLNLLKDLVNNVY